MGQVKGKCKVIRITKKTCDRTTPEGRETALSIARAHLGALLWTSLPCTAGCSWWGINEQRLGDRAVRRKRVREFLAILRAWLPLARLVVERGGSIAWELPRGCWLWHHPKVESVLSESSLHCAAFDGCAFGLKATSGSNTGRPIMKPWAICSD